MARFDWHSDPITRATPVEPGYRNTQNVRRFLIAQCGPALYKGARKRAPSAGRSAPVFI